MKKLLTVFSILILTFFAVLKVQAITFEEAMSQNKPMAVLIYADWAPDVQGVNAMYEEMSKTYANKYNFTKINICKSEALGFNQTYQIYPKLPYVLLFKDKGKISRYLRKECATDRACFKEKLDFFVN